MNLKTLDIVRVSANAHLIDLVLDELLQRFPAKLPIFSDDSSEFSSIVEVGGRLATMPILQPPRPAYVQYLEPARIGIRTRRDGSP